MTRTLMCHCSHGSGVADIGAFDSTSLQECVAKCALRSDCTQVDFDGSKCHIKGVSATPIAWSGHIWKSHSCPKKRATVATKKPAQTTDLICPQNDGKIFEGSDGTWFYNQCCTDTKGASIVGWKAAKDHKDCVEYCVKDKTCKSALFVPETGGQPENCRLYGHGASRPHTQREPTTSTPLPADEANCPDNDGDLVTVGLTDFRLRCNTSFRSNSDSYWTVSGSSIEECGLACAKDTRCVGANLVDLAEGKSCVLHPATNRDGTEVLFGSKDGILSLAPIERGHADKPV